MSEKIVGCPLCRSAVVVHPGLPPSNDKADTFNRCPVRGLNGHVKTHGKSAKLTKSWWPPLRGGKPCLFPLTRQDGSIVKVLDLDVFIRETRNSFDANKLHQLVMDVCYHRQFDQLEPVLLRPRIFAGECLTFLQEPHKTRRCEGIELAECSRCRGRKV